MPGCVLLCVGKLREVGARLLEDEYAKRLGRYISLEIVELPDHPEPRRLSDAEIAAVMDVEGAAILKRLKPADILVALDVHGADKTSEEFASWFGQVYAASPRLCMAIGGSLGLSPSVLKRADTRLSLSSMTLPHALARVMLLEQIYRACKINANERYHK